MFMNKQTDYALRMLRALTDQARHCVRDPAESERVPQAFTYKIVNVLPPIAAGASCFSENSAIGSKELRRLTLSSQA